MPFGLRSFIFGDTGPGENQFIKQAQYESDIEMGLERQKKRKKMSAGSSRLGAGGLSAFLGYGSQSGMYPGFGG